MSTTQYRRPIQYNQKNLSVAANNLKKIQTAYNNLSYRLDTADDFNDPKVDQEVRQIQADFQDAMDDDFNVQNGIAQVYELAKLGNVYSEREYVFKDTIKLILKKLSTMASIFGVKLQFEALNDEKVERLIEERNQARKDRNFARSDEIREDLKSKGIILEDTAQGTRFRRE